MAWKERKREELSGLFLSPALVATLHLRRVHVVFRDDPMDRGFDGSMDREDQEVR